MQEYGRYGLKSKKKSVNANGFPSEHEEQVRVAVWLDKKGLLYTASANGGLRHRLVAMKLKKSGVKGGYPDIMIHEPVGQYHGMLIEMKPQKGGTLTELQKYWIESLNRKGYYAIRANGSVEAIKAIEDYMNGISQSLS